MPDSKRSGSIWRGRGSPRSELGLMTLDWLLIFGAIAGLAAGSVLAVQIVIDDSTDLPDRPDVRVVDAEIAAATVASEATEVMEDNASAYPQLNADFQMDCQEVAVDYNDVVDLAVWVPPTSMPPPPQNVVDQPAKCSLTRP